MARKEIKIFMDAKEAASFLKTIDWSWLFGFLSERYNDCDGVVKERTLALNISLRYTLYDGGYNFATLLYAVYSDVNGWTIQMEKE